MATQANRLLTIEEFDRLYGDAKPYHEYWEGQAIPKPLPTLLHSYLQTILILLLEQIGLAAAGEVRIKLSHDKQPLPDVIAAERLEYPYPTRSLLVAVEILSPRDRVQRLFRKLRFYGEQGIPHIYVFDPDDRIAQRWNPVTDALETIDALQIGDRPVIAVARIWAELDAKLQKVDFLPR